MSFSKRSLISFLGTRPASNPIPGIFARPGIPAFHPWALLFHASSSILVTQLPDGRAERKVVVHEVQGKHGKCVEVGKAGVSCQMTSVSQMPLLHGGAERTVTINPPQVVEVDVPAREPLDQRTEAPSEGYDDAEEVPLPEAPSASRMREGEVPPEEETGMRASQTGEWVS
ncbi:Antigen WC1.1 [Camelus dromedarius]|uniref:Antigen WC1.1 n=1 Tax=Camelus dromedarius TaxID=9838 RepID=A0A5N4C688_CAMDR|nr:Antigen WC1.1 [Camelus dromedarius]